MSQSGSVCEVYFYLIKKAREIGFSKPFGLRIQVLGMLLQKEQLGLWSLIYE